MAPMMSCIVRSAALSGLRGVLLLSPPGGQGLIRSAAAQELAVSVDFRPALEPYGAWHHNRRFGDVWIPANLSRGWRPYTAGHWLYTDDYGWYWVADDQEADWGWITYHYGRWYHDADEGWIWIPKDEWGPAWVDWRYGDQYAGWAPEPPDEFVVEAQDNPTYWSFVTAGDLIAPSIATVLLPFQRREEFFRRTMVVNRPVMMLRSGRQFAVNPGIAPGNIAAIRGRPLPTYNVRPHVLAGTVGVPGAIQVRTADLRRERELGNRAGARERVATREIIRPSSTVIRPARSAAQPQPLARGEVGRLGQAPPRAARGAIVVQSTAQRMPATPSAQQQQEQRQTAAPQRGREPEQRQGNIASPNAPPRPTVQAPAAPRPGAVEQRAGGRGRNQPPTAVERRSTDPTPVARASTGTPQRGPAANRPPAIAAPPPRPSAPPRAAAAPPRAPRSSASRAAAARPRPAAPRLPALWQHRHPACSPAPCGPPPAPPPPPAAHLPRRGSTTRPRRLLRPAAPRRDRGSGHHSGCPRGPAKRPGG